jgi:hypothetical protein
MQILARPSSPETNSYPLILYLTDHIAFFQSFVGKVKLPLRGVMHLFCGSFFLTLLETGC